MNIVYRWLQPRSLAVVPKWQDSGWGRGAGKSRGSQGGHWKSLNKCHLIVTIINISPTLFERVVEHIFRVILILRNIRMSCMLRSLSWESESIQISQLHCNYCKFASWPSWYLKKHINTNHTVPHLEVDFDMVRLFFRVSVTTWTGLSFTLPWAS